MRRAQVLVGGSDSEGRFTARGFTLLALIRTAYRVQEFQIIAGPDWINTDRFDVEGRFPDVDRPPVDLMLRATLAERFKLTVHDDTAARIELPQLRCRRATEDKRS
jgi:uncharacterized protein (TIGR03435 family)